jgi:DNA-directed RNA polymerase subunit RPC12/RpoP
VTITVVTYKCIDCGKERTDIPSHFKKPPEEYRCFTCFNKAKAHKVTYTCIDCGKEKTDIPSRFTKPREEYRCLSCTNKSRIGLSNFRITIACVDCGKEKTGYKFEFNDKTEENYRCRKCYIKKQLQDPNWILHNKEAMEKRGKDPIWREANKKRLFDMMNSPEWERIKIDSMEKRSQNPNYYEQQLIRFTGQGIWYGNPMLSRERKYCELWNKNLWVRIDAAYNYKSILSGKDKFDNGGVHLTRHHVYWQPKACCVWDEDAQGYYAWILNNKKWVKYYIKGDPNKFVLLTRNEHGKMCGNKKEGTDKIYWIKYLEDLIDEREKQGKKCYLSKEEYEIYKVEHADIIKKYTSNPTKTTL